MIHYVTGDATDPPHRQAIIAHIVNDCGAWGAGFVLALPGGAPDRWDAARSRRVRLRPAALTVLYSYCWLQMRQQRRHFEHQGSCGDR